jgi:hypothetical protein
MSDTMTTTTTTLTRTDCKRDNVAVICPNATLLGFGTRKCKSGAWLTYEIDNSHFVGRAIGRVQCEGKTYIEIAQASECFSSVYIRWIDPSSVREIRKSAPRDVFTFFSQEEWKPGTVFKQLEYGVSDMQDQLKARDTD